MVELNKIKTGLLFDRALQYDVVFMIIFCIVGIFIKYFFTENPSTDGISGPASASIWGYGLISLSMFVILFISVGLVQKLSIVEGCGTLEFLKSLLSKSLPPLILLLVLIWAITLNVNYTKAINKDVVPYEYNVADRILSFMILVQIIIIMRYVYNIVTDVKINPTAAPCRIEYENGGMMKGLIMVSVLLGGISSFILAIMHVILAFYITDG